VNLGDQARPPREPLRPGRPTQPVRCSGRMASRIGSSTVFGAPGAMFGKDQRFDVGKLECAQVRAPMQDGGSCPLEMSSTSETPSDRSAITQLACSTMAQSFVSNAISGHSR
jgi:hypothetical protein